jgi:AcrR family transcriptional regulator
MPPTSTSACRWKRRKEERPEEILEAALDLFLSRGYSATRLDDVAASAGVTKGTLYIYFENKEQLFLSVIERHTKWQIEGAQALVAQHRGSVESLVRTLLKAWWDSVLSKNTGGLLKIIIGESANFPTIVSAYQDNVLEPPKAILADVIRRGVESGEFVPVDAEAVSRVPLANLLMLALWRVTFNGGSNADDLTLAVDTMLDVYLRGLKRQPT